MIENGQTKTDGWKQTDGTGLILTDRIGLTEMDLEKQADIQKLVKTDVSKQTETDRRTDRMDSNVRKETEGRTDGIGRRWRFCQMRFFLYSIIKPHYSNNEFKSWSFTGFGELFFGQPIRENFFFFGQPVRENFFFGQPIRENFFLSAYTREGSNSSFIQELLLRWSESNLVFAYCLYAFP